MELNEFDDLFKEDLFDDDFEVMDREKNVVICIYPQSMRNTDASHINYTLKELQKKLYEEAKEEQPVQLAFVFGNKTVYARDFQKLEDDQEICYLDYIRESASLSHIWFLGMALLEKKAEEDSRAGILSENVLCLVTDREFPRVEAAKILNTERFQNLEVRPVLVKSKGAGGGSLEEEIAENGMVFSDTDLENIARI